MFFRWLDSYALERGYSIIYRCDRTQTCKSEFCEKCDRTFRLIYAKKILKRIPIIVGVRRLDKW